MNDGYTRFMRAPARDGECLRKINDGYTRFMRAPARDGECPLKMIDGYTRFMRAPVRDGECHHVLHPPDETNSNETANDIFICLLSGGYVTTNMNILILPEHIFALRVAEYQHACSPEVTFTTHNEISTFSYSWNVCLLVCIMKY